MNKDTRNKLRHVVTQCRKLLEESVSQVLQGRYGIQANGTIEDAASLTHLSEEEQEYREQAIVHLRHIEAAGMKPKDAVAQLIREVAFTHLNRLAAFKLMESRKLIREAVSRGPKSNGYKFYLADHPEDYKLDTGGYQEIAYRRFLLWQARQFSGEIGALFSPNDLANRLFPPQRVLDQVLELINGDDIAVVWTRGNGEDETGDETIGWIYQYFTPKERRDQARKESVAPRNSDELAFRNQFYTPRYVVRFLVDNTLGRVWYEMRKGQTALVATCAYLVRHKNEIFLSEGANSPPAEISDRLSRQQILDLPAHISHRPKKDPRELKVLDPAAGSAHFLIYCFDLLLVIYEEAYADPDLGPTLRKDYPTIDTLKKAVPALILRHNLHGIDIDLRATQIAGLALWLRAQRAYQVVGIKGADRPAIMRANIVCAEPMPGEADLLEEFTRMIQPRVLGQLVKVVFDKMKLAGEAGALLKIEREIRGAIAEAKRQWLAGPKEEQLTLWVGAERPRTEQGILFDVRGVTDEAFWEDVETRVLSALREYAGEASNGKSLSRRLFADDAEQGFGFIDLSQKQYDVVLMNPPFGEPIRRTATYLAENYERSKHDLFAAFLDRAMELVTTTGFVGEISSRVGFFIKSFEQWRTHLLETCEISLLADLGSQVLDSAAVEAACYVVRKGRTAAQPTLVFRLLVETDKPGTLLEAISNLPDGGCFTLLEAQCRVLPMKPFVYWVPKSTLEKFTVHDAVEPKAALVRQGLGTGDNFRFLRTAWEVDARRIAGQGCRSAVEVREQLRGSKVWAFHVCSGASQPWYSPLTLVIDWENDGQRLKEHWRSKGEVPSRYIRSEELYFRPGFSWTRRAFRLIPYVIPLGCIPSASRYMAFPVDELKTDLLGISASAVATAFMRFFGEAFERPNHLVDTFKRLPFVVLAPALRERLREVFIKEVNKRRQLYRNHEPFQEFVLPAKVKQWHNGADTEWDLRFLLGAQLEVEVAKAFGLSSDEFQVLLRDLDEAIAIRRVSSRDANNDEEEPDDTGDLAIDTSPKGRSADLMIYSVGCAVGRWDIRLACDNSLIPSLPDPFLPMPACPPGSLCDADGLPANETPNGYPMRVTWGGILVDDADHPEDVVRRVRDVLTVVYMANADAAERDACELLEVEALRDYFRKSGAGGFWQDHLRRYSKSRRKAPIYWPLQSSKKNYALWLYYNRFDKDTLFKALLNYVEPRVRLEEERLKGLLTQRDSAGATGRAARRWEKNIDKQSDFVSELHDFRDRLNGVADLNLVPDLNDGVVLNIAPLHELVPWGVAKAYWDELVAGKYEWSSIGKQLREKGMVKTSC